MTHEEAFKTLGIPEDSDAESVTKAYREKSLQHHPDKPNGDEEKQKLLNQAKEVAEAFAQQRFGLVLAQQANTSLQAVELALSKERATRNFATARESIRLRRTRSINRIKYAILIFAGLAAFLGWFSDNLLDQFFPATPGDIPNQRFVEFSHTMKWMTLLAGASAALLQFVLQLIEQSLQSYTDRIEDVRECARELAGDLDFEDLSTVEEDRLLYPEAREPARRHSASPPGLLVALRRHERMKLLIPKAVELGLLERVVPPKPDPTANVVFKIAFSPSAFKPSRLAKNTETTAMTLTESAATFVGGAFISFALLALSGYLQEKGHKNWALLPGIVGLFFALMALTGLASFCVNRYKRRR